METKKTQEIKEKLHKINSPLTSLLGYTYFLKEIYKGKHKDSEKEEKIVQNIERDATRLSDMIRELNDLFNS